MEKKEPEKLDYEILLAKAAFKLSDMLDETADENVSIALCDAIVEVSGEARAWRQ